MHSKLIVYTTILLGLLGFIDATYLTILHYKNAIPPCTIAHGCEIVLTSKYSMLGPIPIALLGVLFYLSVLGLLGLLLQGIKHISVGNWKLDIGYWIFLLTFCSLIVSAILLALQAFVLHAFCQYCLISEGINGLLFLILFIPVCLNHKNTKK